MNAKKLKEIKMSTIITPEISKKNKYWIDKHRHYELKHFCMQYPKWKEAYSNLNDTCISTSVFDKIPSGNLPSNPTVRRAVLRVYYAERIDLIEKTAINADQYLHKYILKAVTENLSYAYLKARLDIPCSRDMYYDRYRRFFWLLSEARQ